MLKLVAFIGPSGAGKTTIAKSLGLKPFTTLTTRNPRPNDKEGEDYHFISVEDFLDRRAKGYLVEDVEYAGNYYGTDKRDLEKVLNSKDLHYVVITYDGFKHLEAHVPYDSIISIFIGITKDNVEERLTKRGESSEVICRRLNSYYDDYKNFYKCNYSITNNGDWESLETVTNSVRKFIKKRQLMDKIKHFTRELTSGR